ncbi:MAG TPA: GNAT family N-acetyltransferase [Candidatus Binatia bacterium]|nr:GNAT family N-acetyltransferase [Candidatus Binatia bacterium]
MPALHLGGRGLNVAVWQPADPSHAASMLALMRHYYFEDGYAFVLEQAAPALEKFLGSPELGRAWILLQDGIVRGYVLLTFGYSLEYRGRDAFIDEIYVAPDLRGQGQGAIGLAVAEEGARACGVRVLHLEVEKAKPRTAAFYRRVGFADHDRWLMSKTLT